MKTFSQHLNHDGIESMEHKKADSNEGLLFFTQRMHEMLFHYTIDIFKAPLLNTRLLAKELLETWEDVKANSDSPQDNKIFPILEELKTSFCEDSVLKSIFSAQERDFVRKKIDDSNETNRLQGIQYLYNRLSYRVYYNAARDLLLETVPLAKEKRKIDAISRIFVTELISCGYSQEYIFHELKQKMLIKRNEIGVEDMAAFLEQFDFKTHSYDVYFVAEAHGTRSASSQLSFLKGFVSFEDDGNFEKVSKKCEAADSDTVFHIQGTTSLDAYGAARQADQLLDFLTRFHMFLVNEKGVDFFEKCAVSDSESKTFVYPNCGLEAHHLIKPLPGTQKGIAESAMKMLFGTMQKTRDTYEFSRITKAIDLHNSSITINSYQNSFLCLWTALEVLCERESRKPLIDSICSMVTNVLEMRYLTNVLNDLECSLKKRHIEYNKLLSIKHADDRRADQFAQLIFSSEKEADLELLLGMLANHPLLRNRIWELHEQGKERKKLAGRVTAYGKRVDWHIRRMYRTRNRIVHAGETPRYLESLGEHLHMYLDELLQELLSQLTNKGCKGVRSALTGISYEHEMYIKRLQDNNLSQEENYTYYSW